MILGPTGKPIPHTTTGSSPDELARGGPAAFFQRVKQAAEAGLGRPDVPFGERAALMPVAGVSGLYAAILGAGGDVLRGQVHAEDAGAACRLVARSHLRALKGEPLPPQAKEAVAQRMAVLDRIASLAGAPWETPITGLAEARARAIALWALLAREVVSAIAAHGAPPPQVLGELVWLTTEAAMLAQEALS